MNICCSVNDLGCRVVVWFGDGQDCVLRLYCPASNCVLDQTTPSSSSLLNFINSLCTFICVFLYSVLSFPSSVTSTSCIPVNHLHAAIYQRHLLIRQSIRSTQSRISYKRRSRLSSNIAFSFSGDQSVFKYILQLHHSTLVG